MSETDLLCNLTIRLSFQMLQAITTQVGKGKKFENKSDAARYYIERGQQFEALLEIHNNPEAKVEFEGKLEALLKEKQFEQVLETMDVGGLKAVQLLAKNIEDKKVQQLLLDIKRG